MTRLSPTILLGAACVAIPGFASDTWATQTETWTVQTTSPAPPPLPPAQLPAPPPPVAGCYQYTGSGWESVSCATDSYIDQHFPHPDAQLTLASPGTPSLVFGQLWLNVLAVGSESNAFIASTGAIESSCKSTGSPVPNQWSVQSNTNQWRVPSTAASGAGDSAATQFTIQSDGSESAICIWNIDVTKQDYQNKSCVVLPQRSGGLQPSDFAQLAATANPNGTLTLMGQLSWVPSGQTPVFMAVNFADMYGLGSNWSEVSGGLLGFGNCSQAQLTDAQVVTQIAASTCPGDTSATSSTCAPPTLQPNATAFVGGTGTVETSNLTAIGTPSVAYLNSDLAVTYLVSSTSGTCLAPISGDAPASMCSCPASATWSPTYATCVCSGQGEGIINGRCVNETCPPGYGVVIGGNEVSCFKLSCPASCHFGCLIANIPPGPTKYICKLSNGKIP
jgi:hypothetical protein